MSHASCTQKLVFPFKSAPALTNVRRCSNLDSMLECCLFVFLQEFRHPEYMHLVLHLLVLGAKRPASKRPFFQTRLLHLYVFQTRQLGARCILLRPVVKYCGSVGVRHIAVSFKMEAFVKVSHFSCAATASSFQRHFDF